MNSQPKKSILRQKTAALKDLRELAKHKPFTSLHYDAACDAVRLMIEYGNKLKKIKNEN